MERILYSNSIPSRFHRRNSPTLPRLVRVDSPRKLLTPPSPSPSFSRRFIPLYCALHDSNSISPKRSGDGNLFLSPDSVNGSEAEPEPEPEPKPHFVKQIGQILLSQQQKVLKAGTVILLSAVLLTLLHPAIVPPAFASFPSVATAGGSRLIQNELLSSSWAGFFAGCLHTLSGPDHLAALAPLSIGRTRMESAAVGALWGCGHDAGQVIFGLLFLLLKDRLHIEVIRTWGSIVVGITLLVIGALGIKEAIEVPAPCVTMENGVSGYDVLTSQPTGKKKIGFATFATGIVHGLQPDALMMIVPALALPSRLAGAAFLLMFLVGTVIAMGSYTVFIGSCSQALKERVPRITEKLTWASSLIAIALGLSLLVSQFFGFSLY